MNQKAAAGIAHETPENKWAKVGGHGRCDLTIRFPAGILTTPAPFVCLVCFVGTRYFF